MATDQLALGETDTERKAGGGRKGLDTAEVRRRLAVRHAWPEWLFFEEVPFDDQEKNRMRLADCIALPTYQSRGYVVHGFEIKVTRSDWLRELKEGAKAEAIAKDVDRFWLVLGDPNIAVDEEVPPAWGVMVPNGDGLRVRRQAKALRDDNAPMDRRFLVTLARKAQKMANDRANKDATASFERGYEAGTKARCNEHGQAPEKVRAYDVLVEALGHHTSYGALSGHQIEEIKLAYDTGRAVLGRGWNGLDVLPDLLDRHAREVSEALRESAKVLREALVRVPPPLAPPDPPTPHPPAGLAAAAPAPDRLALVIGGPDWRQLPPADQARVAAEVQVHVDEGEPGRPPLTGTAYIVDPRPPIPPDPPCAPPPPRLAAAPAGAAPAAAEED